jgi:hypothetical protein
MQSGQAKTKNWVLEFEPELARKIEPLMGWTSSADMRQQIRLKFDTREAAVAYAKANNIPHRVVEPKERKRKPKAYADNFAFDRKQPWTH